MTDRPADHPRGSRRIGVVGGLFYGAFENVNHQDGSGETVRIDCDCCKGRGLACGDCVVTLLLGGPPADVELDSVIGLPSRYWPIRDWCRRFDYRGLIRPTTRSLTPRSQLDTVRRREFPQIHGKKRRRDLNQR